LAGAVVFSIAAAWPRVGVAAVVGTGTPASCTEAAFDTALGAGGSITFDCGVDLLTIVFTTPKTITGSVTIDGANLITLAGGGTVRPFTVGAGATLAPRRLEVAQGGRRVSARRRLHAFIVGVRSPAAAKRRSRPGHPIRRRKWPCDCRCSRTRRRAAATGGVESATMLATPTIRRSASVKPIAMVGSPAAAH